MSLHHFDPRKRTLLDKPLKESSNSECITPPHVYNSIDISDEIASLSPDEMICHLAFGQLVFLLGLVFLSSKAGEDSRELLLISDTKLSRWKLTPQLPDLFTFDFC